MVDATETSANPAPTALPNDTIFAIDAAIDAELRATGGGGMAYAITGRDGLLATGARGLANIDAGVPVTNDTLFEFGSIGKSFTAILLLQLAETGAIDLHQPVETYLPWFAVRSSPAPITLHHLLTHTSGLIGGHDASPDQRYEVWALRETDTFAEPGSRFHYSNVGYKTLGLVLEAVTDQPYARLVRERIFAPLGMTQSEAAINSTMRSRLAVGYQAWFDDRPWRPEHGLAPATWLETDTADGCLSATASDLAAYCRALLNDGSYPDGHLLSSESFAALIGPYIEMTPGMGYGYGLMTSKADGRRILEHSGGMVGYTAHLIGDRDAGIGVVTMTNGRADCGAVARFALDSARAAILGETAPEAPRPGGSPVVEDPGQFAGVFTGVDGSLEIVSEGNGLALRQDNDLFTMTPRGASDAGMWLVDHPDFALFPLRFGRDEAGAVVEVSHGERWFAGEGYAGPREFAYPKAWDACRGHYRSHCPWLASFRIILRKGMLYLVSGGGSEQELEETDGEFHEAGKPLNAERIRFDAIVDGQAFRATLSGDAPYYRFFTA